ncbi:MAG: anti-sigma regulatory factor [Actinobacteria bacterium 13_2_20CM_2_71_6]|nr:MAG: anti-sigma regulatory factor [Actinobacteria bacterium 13_2_20CM_2_71_6]
MMSLSTEDALLTMTINGEADLLRVRSTLRAAAQYAGLSLTAETKLVTAGSELARNIVRYATHGQGMASIERLEGSSRRGVRAVFSDTGPGIADLDEVMRDGFSTGGSLGLGLPGSRRLVDEFSIDSAAGGGTTVTIEQWAR